MGQGHGVLLGCWLRHPVLPPATDTYGERGIPHIYGTGNHDKRTGLCAVLGSGHLESSELQPTVGLRNADALAEVLTDGDVRAVLCGHFHLQLTGLLAGVPVWVGPAVATRIDLTTPPHLERAVTGAGAGATVVDLGGLFSPAFHTLHARDPLAGEQVYLVEAMSGVDVDGE